MALALSILPLHHNDPMAQCPHRPLVDLHPLRLLPNTTDTIRGTLPTINSIIMPTVSMAEETALHGRRLVMEQRLGLTLGLSNLPKPASYLSPRVRSWNAATAMYLERGAMVIPTPTTTDYDSMMITPSGSDVRKLMPRTGKAFLDFLRKLVLVSCERD